MMQRLRVLGPKSSFQYAAWSLGLKDQRMILRGRKKAVNTSLNITSHGLSQATAWSNILSLCNSLIKLSLCRWRSSQLGTERTFLPLFWEWKMLPILQMLANNLWLLWAAVRKHPTNELSQDANLGLFRNVWMVGDGLRLGPLRVVSCRVWKLMMKTRFSRYIDETASSTYLLGLYGRLNQSRFLVWEDFSYFGRFDQYRLKASRQISYFNATSWSRVWRAGLTSMLWNYERCSFPRIVITDRVCFWRRYNHISCPAKRKETSPCSTEFSLQARRMNALSMLSIWLKRWCFLPKSLSYS